eukprot:TRINITY_DN11979_c1_g2_i1.p3 TRINITY_DN11979_c1_g2~~TRINITY_DN11979_c1_g2_i1.p3  ORF type:complete len:150 (-),score=39.65 TRINITY_DN11979_c1_g2_i1:2359-2808(-)
MMDCWHTDPLQRPEFELLTIQLQSMVDGVQDLAVDVDANHELELKYASAALQSRIKDEHVFAHISRKRAELVLAQFLLYQREELATTDVEAFLARSKDEQGKAYAISLTFKDRYIHHTLTQGIMCWYLNSEELPCGYVVLHGLKGLFSL